MNARPNCGDLVECSDPAIREYILYLNSMLSEEKKFVLKDLPPTHLFIKPGKSPEINEKINELIDKYTFETENK